jgi:hypothetical protein
VVEIEVILTGVLLASRFIFGWPASWPCISSVAAAGVLHLDTKDVTTEE